jgi:hypothetical protein
MPNQPKALAISEGYHTNITENRMAKWLEGNTVYGSMLEGEA